MEPIARLVEMFGPPETDPGPIDWERIEGLNGIVLPSDYMRWAGSYTSIYVDGFLRILHPINFFAISSRAQIAAELAGVEEIDPPLRNEVYNSAGVLVAEELPMYPPFGEPGSLLPWGNTDNGDMLMWETSNERPDGWRVVVVDGDSNVWQEFDCGFAEFLIGLFDRQFIQVNLPSDIKPAVKEFQGYRVDSDDRKTPIWRASSDWIQYFEQKRDEIEEMNRRS